MRLASSVAPVAFLGSISASSSLLSAVPRSHDAPHNPTLPDLSLPSERKLPTPDSSPPSLSLSYPSSSTSYLTSATAASLSPSSLPLLPTLTLCSLLTFYPFHNATPRFGSPLLPPTLSSLCPTAFSAWPVVFVSGFLLTLSPLGVFAVFVSLVLITSCHVIACVAVLLLFATTPLCCSSIVLCSLVDLLRSTNPVWMVLTGRALISPCISTISWSSRM